MDEFKKIRKPATTKVMDYLGIREHSEDELRQKLKNLEYEQVDIDQAIQYAKTKKWIPDTPEQQMDLSYKVASQLNRKFKGIHYINQYLETKGLPAIPIDDELELEKARTLLENKTSSSARKKDMNALARVLQARGFDESTIRKACHDNE